MKRFFQIPLISLIPLIAAILCTACTQQSLETTYSNQESRIDSFIENLMNSENPPVRVIHNNGSNRIVLGEYIPADDTDMNYREELTESGSVSFYYAGYVFSGSTPSSNNLFATNNQDVAVAAGWELTNADYNILTLNMSDKGALVEGLRNGMIGVRGQDTCYVVFSGKYGFGDKAVGIVPANSALIYQIWVESVNND